MTRLLALAVAFAAVAYVLARRWRLDAPTMNRVEPWSWASGADNGAWSATLNSPDDAAWWAGG